MKSSALALVLFALLPGAARAEPAAPAAIRLAAGSRLWIEGDSSLHRYHIEASTLEPAFTFDGARDPAHPTDARALVLGHHVLGFELRVPVAGLRSGNASMDANTRRALGGDRHQDIAFHLRSYELRPDGARLAGRLSIAGVERPIEMFVRLAPDPSGLRATGAVRLRMSDFGVKPPKLMGGILRVADPVTVRFDLRLAN